MKLLRFITRSAAGSRARSLSLIVLLASIVSQGWAEAHSAGRITAILDSADIHIKVCAGVHAPSLLGISGKPDNIWHNEEAEAPPSQIYIGNAWIPVSWSFRPDLSSADSHHIDFVYESAKSHLRLHWRWKARADSGPIEHSIQMVNLSRREIWLPLIDSLRLDLQVPASTTIENLYIEKGADTPSDQGTHLETVTNGYHWMGRSTTYAHPIKGQQREIIPAMIVYQPNTQGSSEQDQDAGWYAGIEFSGRTRLTLDRAGLSLKSVLGLNPELGPFRTRLLPNESFESPTIFLGAFTGSVDDAGNQLRTWVRNVLTNPGTWQDPQYP